MRQYEELFSRSGVTLKVEPEALAANAKCAIERKTGARGLRATMEEILLESMYDLPDLAEDVETVVISADVVINNAVPEHMPRASNDSEDASRALAA